MNPSKNEVFYTNTDIKIKPVSNYVIITKIDLLQRSDYLELDVAKKDKMRNILEGEVLFYGGGRVKEDGTLLPAQFKVGDKVIFMEGRISNGDLDGKSIFSIKEDHIIAKIDVSEDKKEDWRANVDFTDLNPVSNTILIEEKRKKQENIKKGKLILPFSVKEETLFKSKVLKVGGDVRGIKPGMQIIYTPISSFSLSAFHEKAKDLAFIDLKNNEILGIEEE